MPFTSARVPAPKTVIYRDDSGNETVREGGSRAWRNNNPGNIEKGTFADAQGAIGADTRFAIFADEAAGRAALIALLSSPSYNNLTLEAAINRYAPPDENNTAGYVEFLVHSTGIAKTTILSSLNKTQRGAVADAIKRVEGWNPGKEFADAPQVMAGPSPLPAPLSSAAAAADDWMKIALAEAALPPDERSEIAGPAANPRIMNYFHVAAPWFDAKAEGGDEVDWCAVFVDFCLEAAGYTGTGHPGARSFFWNKNHHFIEIPLAQPKYGCIAVFRDAISFNDPGWSTGSGHVAFVVDWTATTIDLLGGNQGRTVSRQTFQREYQSGGTVTRRLEKLFFPAMN